MKKISFIILLSALAGCFGTNHPTITGMEGKPMPSFDLLLMDSSTLLKTANIPSGEPVVLFYFNPYCPYCRAQTEDMISEIKSLNNIRIYFLSNFPFASIKSYYDHYKLKNYANITVGQDYAVYFGSYYKAPGVPYTAIYNKNKELKQVLVGKVGTNVIRDIASE